MYLFYIYFFSIGKTIFKSLICVSQWGIQQYLSIIIIIIIIIIITIAVELCHSSMQPYQISKLRYCNWIVTETKWISDSLVISKWLITERTWNHPHTAQIWIMPIMCCTKKNYVIRANLIQLSNSKKIHSFKTGKLTWKHLQWALMNIAVICVF